MCTKRSSGPLTARSRNVSHDVSEEAALVKRSSEASNDVASFLYYKLISVVLLCCHLQQHFLFLPNNIRNVFALWCVMRLHNAMSQMTLPRCEDDYQQPRVKKNSHLECKREDEIERATRAREKQNIENQRNPANNQQRQETGTVEAEEGKKNNIIVYEARVVSDYYSFSSAFVDVVVAVQEPCVYQEINYIATSERYSSLSTILSGAVVHSSFRSYLAGIGFRRSRVSQRSQWFVLPSLPTLATAAAARFPPRLRRCFRFVSISKSASLSTICFLFHGVARARAHPVELFILRSSFRSAWSAITSWRSLNRRIKKYVRRAIRRDIFR